MNNLSQPTIQEALADSVSRNFVIGKHRETGALVSFLANKFDAINYIPFEGGEEEPPAQKGEEEPPAQAWANPEATGQGAEEEELAKLKASRVWLHGSPEEKARYDVLKAKSKAI